MSSKQPDKALNDRVVLCGGLAYPHLAEDHWFEFWRTREQPKWALARLHGKTAVAIVRLFDLGQWTGIGGVFTLDGYRRMGYAKQLLEAVSAPNLALWCEDHEKSKLYTGLGFRDAGALTGLFTKNEQPGLDWPGGRW